MRKNIGGCSAIRSDPSLSSWNYLKHKLKTISAKLSDFPQNTSYYTYITVKNILGLFHPFIIFQPVLDLFHPLRYLSTSTRSISPPSVSFNRYWVYFAPLGILQPVSDLFQPCTNNTYNHNNKSQRHQANTGITSDCHEDNHHTTHII